MSSAMFLLTGIFLIGLLAIFVYRCITYKDLRSFIFQLIGLGIITALLYKFFYVSGSVVAKGIEDFYFVIVLFIFMLMGMLANYSYSRFSKPKEERPLFDFGMFIAPVFASPIIFIPMYAAFQDAHIDLRIMDRAKLMIFLVAFQNGFFWKEYFDNLQKQKRQGRIENAQENSKSES